MEVGTQTAAPLSFSTLTCVELAPLLTPFQVDRELEHLAIQGPLRDGSCESRQNCLVHTLLKSLLVDLQIADNIDAYNDSKMQTLVKSLSFNRRTSKRERMTLNKNLKNGLLSGMKKGDKFVDIESLAGSSSTDSSLGGEGSRASSVYDDKENNSHDRVTNTDFVASRKPKLLRLLPDTEYLCLPRPEAPTNTPRGVTPKQEVSTTPEVNPTRSFTTLPTTLTSTTLTDQPRNSGSSPDLRQSVSSEPQSSPEFDIVSAGSSFLSPADTEDLFSSFSSSPGEISSFRPENTRPDSPTVNCTVSNQLCYHRSETGSFSMEPPKDIPILGVVDEGTQKANKMILGGKGSRSRTTDPHTLVV